MEEKKSTTGFLVEDQWSFGVPKMLLLMLCEGSSESHGWGWEKGKMISE